MKPLEKQRARELRLDGWSVRGIAQELSVSQGSVSLWVRDIQLDADQQSRLYSNAIIAATAATRSRKIRRWDAFETEAAEEWPALSLDPGFMFGLALYVGEGAKNNPNSLELSNCDPGVIRKTIAFWRSLGTPEFSFRMAVHLHDTGDVGTAEAFWVRETGIPRNQFTSTVRATSKASSRKKGNIQPFGTCHARVHSTRLRQKVGWWMTMAPAESQEP